MLPLDCDARPVSSKAAIVHVNTSPMTLSARIFAGLTLLTLAATFLAARIDFAHRHHIGVSAVHYWWPQLMQIWLPGLGTAATCAVIAFALHRARAGA